MGFFDRLMRRAASAGTPGETARVVGQQYLALKGQNPDASDEEILKTIMAARHAAQPYTPEQLARLESHNLGDAVGRTIRWKLVDFVTHLILVESNVSAREIQGSLQSIVGAINDELRKLGLE